MHNTPLVEEGCGAAVGGVPPLVVAGGIVAILPSKHSYLSRIAFVGDSIAEFTIVVTACIAYTVASELVSSVI
jgi:hypothetical protein